MCDILIWIFFSFCNLRDTEQRSYISRFVFWWKQPKLGLLIQRNKFCLVVFKCPFFVFLLHKVVVFLSFIKRSRTDPMSLFKQTTLSLNCFSALILMPHRLDGQIGSLQTSCPHWLCVQLACSVTSFSGYYQKIGKRMSPSQQTSCNNTAESLRYFWYQGKLFSPGYLSWFSHPRTAHFVNPIILIPVTILSSSNAGSFSRVTSKIQRRQQKTV